MKTFLKVIGVIVALVVVVVLVGFFLPSKVHVQRSAVIKASPEMLYNQVASMKNWNTWSPWQKYDPKMQMDYFGPESGTGAGYTWKSSNDRVGNGKMTVQEAKPNEIVKTQIEFMGHGTSTADFMFKTVDGGTEVTWSMDSDMGNNPMMRYMGLMMDKMVGPDFERGLHNLDSVVAHIPQSASPSTENAPSN